MIWEHDAYPCWITDDKRSIDFDTLYDFLANRSYWSKNIPKEVLARGIENSLNFSVLWQDSFIGFARIISDFATFAYLADVYINKSYRGKGLGTWLINIIMKHPELQGLRNWTLFTVDAQQFYEKCGWMYLDKPNRLMVIRKGVEMYSESH